DLYVDPVYNKQNDRVICFGNTKHPGLRDDVGDRGINRGQDAADLVPDGYRLTGPTTGAFEDQGTPIGLQITKKSGKSSYVFQQDGAPAHTCKAVQDWMETNMKFWPKHNVATQSPDLNPLDFSF
ncbi:Uncharacterized protein FKW44_017770, partial [Caligus rogercresseyi]